MSFRALHRALEGAEPHISRNAIKTEVLSLVGADTVLIIRAELDGTACRGFYVSASNLDHPFAKYGRHVIVVRRGMNRCWERFVIVKELMHMLDGAAAATDNGDKFDLLLNDLQPNTTERSEVGRAEILAFWKALGALCPERVRLQFAAERRTGHLSDADIAKRLLIPEQYVPNLFSTRFQVTMRLAMN